MTREPSGLNEQLFAQMLQAQQAAAGGDGSAADPASADKQGSAADGKKKVPVMLKGARLAFSRPGIIAGRQPGPSRPSPGSQVAPPPPPPPGRRFAHLFLHKRLVAYVLPAFASVSLENFWPPKPLAQKMPLTHNICFSLCESACQCNTLFVHY